MQSLTNLIKFTILVFFIQYSPSYSQEEMWNLTSKGIVDASSFSPGFPPENAISANGSLCWVTEEGGFQWLEIYFDDPVVISHFELKFGYEYGGESINIYGRNQDGFYTKLHQLGTEDLDGDSALVYEPENNWENITYIRIESPESPLYLCWRDLGLIGYIPGRTAPPEDIDCGTAPDKIYMNGTVITMDAALPAAEALAVKNGKILGVGDNNEVLSLRVPGCQSEIVDLNGLVVLPGFNDAHNHILSWPQEICYPSGDTIYRTLEERLNTASAFGWTSMSELGFGRPGNESREHLHNALALDFRGELPIRINGYYGSLFELYEFDILRDSGLYAGQRFSGRVRTPGVKLYIDHPLGIDDGPYTQEQVNELVSRAREDGWQIVSHAVNTNGVEKILTAYELSLAPGTNINDRYRIEHAVKVSDDQLIRMKEKGIIASFQLIGPPDWPLQPSHHDYISNTNPEWQMRWREFVDSGIPSTGSTDYPFNNAPCHYSPFRAIYEGVSRKGYVEREHADWEISQRLTIEQCIKLLTIDGAYATKEEDIKGSITPGKWADLVFVSANPLEVSEPEELLSIEVLMTMTGGIVEYCNPSATGLCDNYEAFGINSALITASDYIEGQTPDLVYDGNNDNNWSSGGFAPQWIQIDMLRNYKINGIDLIVDQYPGGFTRHELLGKPSSFSENFQLLHEFQGVTDYGQILHYIAPEETDSLRFIKINTLESPSWGRMERNRYLQE